MLVGCLVKILYKKAPERNAREPFDILFKALYFFPVALVPLPFLVPFSGLLGGVGLPEPFPAIDLTSYGGKIVKEHISAQLSHH